MTESSHPRPPRWAHSVFRPGDASRPGDGPPGAPGDIDVTQVVRDAARGGRTPRALSGPPRRRPGAPAAGTGVPAGRTGPS
ncbi:hypothetical protein [Streptomyces caelestis]|uniref:hypothetical protein n=1 Tax=Streptomyces caelestis TaxID=36816 RepID=UPI00366991AD